MDQKEKVAHAYAEIRKQSPWHQPRTPSILHHRILPHATYALWLSDQKFQDIYRKIEPSTMVDIYRCYELWLLAKQSIYVSGDIWRLAYGEEGLEH